MIISVIGLFFGDEGKGHTVAYLTKRYNALANIRFSGGSQAAHRVVVNGKSHIFAQFGSGSAVSSTVKTYLTHQMAIDPLNLLEEARVHKANGLGDLMSRLVISADAPIITPWHKLINQAREIGRGVNRISTTGLGVGEVFEDIKNSVPVFSVKDMFTNFDQKLKEIEIYKKEQAAFLSWPGRQYFVKWLDQTRDLMKLLIKTRFYIENCWLSSPKFNSDLMKVMDVGNVIFEGSQGTLLDRDFGYKPYITKSNVALPILNEFLSQFPDYYCERRLNLGIMRPYITRHGLGPLPTEDKELTQRLPDSNNTYNEWQGHLRCGWLDLNLLQYSLGCNKDIEGLVITNEDRIPEECFYRLDETDKIWEDPSTMIQTDKSQLLSIIEKVVDIPVMLESSGEEDKWMQRCLL